MAERMLRILAITRGWSLRAERMLRMLKALGSDTNASISDDGVLTTETEITPLLGLIGSLPMVTAQAHIC